MFIITQVYPFAETPQAFHEWDVAPNKFTKILIEVGSKK
jgi:hypothetical protein